MPMSSSSRPHLYPMDAETAAFGDAELVGAIYDLVTYEVDDDRLSDEFYGHLTEAFERFAPEAEWAYAERQYRDDPDRETELASVRESMERRRATRELFRQHFTIGSAS